MAPNTTPTRKRIIVCCDGTWMDSDGEYQTPSNVTRIARAIKPVGRDEHGNAIPQVIFYQNGVGTGSKSLYVKYVGGATGDGLANNIREAYAFICQNYVHGDEIFLIGFSRGAFTARSISSLIRALGLLTSKGQEYFYSIFEDWQYQLKPGYKTQWPDHPWPGHAPPVNGPEYQRKLLELEMTRPNIPIKAVAVWDTVGGLGIPMIGLLPQPPSTDFAFVDTKVEKNIEYAFQALALDEHRRAYHPTVWEKPAGQEFPRVLKQTWFPGVHSDVGGSYPDTDLANLTLCWMVSQLSPLLAFEYNYIWTQVRLGIEKHTHQEQKQQGEGASSSSSPDHQKHQQQHQHQQQPSSTAQTQARTPTMTPITPTRLPTNIRPWGLGKIHNSMTVFFRLGGSKTRTPGEYTTSERATQHGTLWWVGDKLATRFLHRLGFFNEKPMPRLQNTHETFHSSVRIRMGMKGKGYDDKGVYNSPALAGWVMEGERADPDTPWQTERPGMAGAMKKVRWRKKIVVDVDVVNPPAAADGNVGKNGSAAKTHAANGNHKKNAPEVLEIPEDEMGEFEKRILHLWPEISDEFAFIVPEGARCLEHDDGVNGNKRARTFPTSQDDAFDPPPMPKLNGEFVTVNGTHHATAPGTAAVNGTPAAAAATGASSGIQSTTLNTAAAGDHHRQPSPRRLSVDTRAAAAGGGRGGRVQGEGGQPTTKTSVKNEDGQEPHHPPDRADTA